jgi:hypothetical protein
MDLNDYPVCGYPTPTNLFSQVAHSGGKAPQPTDGRARNWPRELAEAHHGGRHLGRPKPLL